MSNIPKDIIIQSAKIDRLDSDNIVLTASASVLDDESNNIPKIQVALIVNRQETGIFSSDSDGYIDITQSCKLKEEGTLSIQIKEAISGVRSKVKTLSEKGDKKDNKTINNKIDKEGKTWLKEKFESYKSLLAGYNKLEFDLAKIGEIESLIIEFEKFNDKYFDYLSWSQQKFYVDENEYTKIKNNIINKCEIKNKFLCFIELLVNHKGNSTEYIDGIGILNGVNNISQTILKYIEMNNISSDNIYKWSAEIYKKIIIIRSSGIGIPCHNSIIYTLLGKGLNPNIRIKVIKGFPNLGRNFNNIYINLIDLIEYRKNYLIYELSNLNSLYGVEKINGDGNFDKKSIVLEINRLEYFREILYKYGAKSGIN